MATDKQIIAFKLGARARKFLNEDCPIEGYEILFGSISEMQASGDTEMEMLLKSELEKFENRVAIHNGTQ